MEPKPPDETDLKENDKLKLASPETTSAESDSDSTVKIIVNYDNVEPQSNVNTLGDTKDQADSINRSRGAATDRLINTIIAGHYQIIDFIGLGGMGKVYKAHHTLLRRLVAIKFLQENKIGHDEATLRRFQQEAQTVVKLNHPGIPALREFGVTGEIPYIVMDFVEGKSLGTLIQEKALTPKDVCIIGAQICDALEHAHQNKIIHRDIKPSNILVSPS